MHQDAVPAGHPDSLVERICRACVDRLDIDAAAVSMRLQKLDLVLVHASSPWITGPEQQAANLGEGPQADVLTGQTAVLSVELPGRHASTQWPVWAPVAIEAGARAVSCFPIIQGAIVAGTLTMYTRGVHQLDGPQLSAAFRLADAALVALLDVAAGIDVTGELSLDTEPTAAPPPLLRPRVHQAAGMVMVQANVSIDDAMVLLRASAFRSNRAISAVADDVVARLIRFDSDPRRSQ